MKADLTRDTFRPEQRYARVIFPQGHAITEAELNEQAQIQVHRDRATARDVIGASGTPNGDSFELVASPDHGDLLIRPGHYYVDGQLVEGDGEWVAASFPGGGLVELPSLTLDGRALQAGEWLELSAPGVATHRFRITAVDAANRQLTLGASDVGPSPDTTPIGVAGARARRIASYLFQPDWPRPESSNFPAAPALAALTLTPGVYGAYLEVFSHHVSSLSDRTLSEVALGGVDGASRARTAWQLRLRTLGAVGTPATCATVLPAQPTAATLAARAKRPATGTNPCIIEPAAQYRRLENQLYRVEIHHGGTLGVDADITFKWSRENGSVAMPWLTANATELTLATVGRDSKLGLSSGDWIELCDDQVELSRTPGTLVQIDSVEGTTVLLKPGTATGSTAIADFPFNPRVRRWDHVGTAALKVERPATNDGFLALEDGVEVRFDDGSYRTGDHWLIPARTLTGDVEWPRDLDGLPIARPSHDGATQRVALAVVEWNAGVIKVLSDCREQFPPLTHICADDVCLADDPCGRGWNNVQEAIEGLCHDHDLQFHNQHLHGWGVVCGLQVQCMTQPYAAAHPNIARPREWVLLRDGYAIHPTGSDIRVSSSAGDGITAVDLVQLAIAEGVLTRNPDGSVPDSALSLWIDQGGGPVTQRLHVESYDPKHKRTAEELLEGTILIDIWNDCVKRVVDFFKDQLQPGPAGTVDARAARLIALLNLIWQLINQTSGRHIYLSGDPAAPDSSRTEDGLLRELFAGLKELLQSNSFCAMFDDIHFPDYDVYRAGLPATAPLPTTIFGTLHHTRIRVHPRLSLAFTCGAGNQINVYDISKNQYLASTPFPSTSAEVQDVAFGLSGNEIYAIAWIGDAKVDSVFAIGSVQSDGKIMWGADQVQCSLKLISLAVDERSTGKVFASARGKGLYTFDLTKPSELPAQLSGFSASGHLVVTHRSNQTVLYAGAHDSDANPVAFTHVRGVQVATPSAVLRFALPAQGVGHDDLALAIGPGGVDELYAIIDAVDDDFKRLVVWNPLNPAAATGPGAPPVRIVPLGESAASRIAYSPAGNWSLISYEDTYLGHGYRPQQVQPEQSIHPLQIGPCSIATDREGRAFYVLNWISNTITVVPATGRDAPWESAIDRPKLEDYRWQAISAFIKSLGRFAQFMKDCVCEHLLIHCPEPDGKKVYLSDVSIKNGGIYQICNFHHRKYVHTFPTVEYWMSFVPFLPMLKQAVEKACCSVISGVFDKLAPPKDPAASKKDFASASKLRYGVSHAQELGLASELRGRKAQFAVARSVTTDAITRKLAQPAAGRPAAAVASVDIVAKSQADAAAEAQKGGVRVRNVRVADNEVVPTLKWLAVSPKLNAGDEIELVTDRRGKVIGVEKLTPSAGAGAGGTVTTPGTGTVGPAAPDPAILAALAAREAETNALKQELAAFKTSSDERTRTSAAEADALRQELALQKARNDERATSSANEAAALKRELATMKTSHDEQLSTLDGLRTKMTELEGQLPRRRSPR